MVTSSVTAKVLEIASLQHGFMTTAQAERRDVSRLQLSRLNDAGILERIQRGIYAIPGSIDEYSQLRASWLSINPETDGGDRLTESTWGGVVSHASAAHLLGLGDLQFDEPELTVPARTQSRRGTRFHVAKLESADVTIARGLPVTTPARTIVDLIADGHDADHVAHIAAQALRTGTTTKAGLIQQFERLDKPKSNMTAEGRVEQLLDHAGISNVATVKKLQSLSELYLNLVTTQNPGLKESLKQVTQSALSVVGHFDWNTQIPDLSSLIELPQIDVSKIISSMPKQRTIEKAPAKR